MWVNKRKYESCEHGIDWDINISNSYDQDYPLKINKKLLKECSERKILWYNISNFISRKK